MSEVKRYDLSLPTNFGMRLSEDGCWVEHESYAALESKLASLRAERDQLRARVEELERRQAMLRYCATKLRQLGKGNSAAAQEGL